MKTCGLKVVGVRDFVHRKIGQFGGCQLKAKGFGSDAAQTTQKHKQTQ